MNADTITAIKKADNAPDRIWATVNGMSTRVPDGVRQLVGGWSQDADRAGAVEYVRASTLESLQRENEALRAFASSFKLSHNEKAFYGDCYIHIDNPDKVSFRLGNGSEFSRFIGNLEKRRIAALASTGGEHHAE